MTTRDVTMQPSAERTLRALGAVLCATVLTVACTTGADAPRAVPFGEDIAVGPYSLRLLRATPTPNPPPPISTLQPQAGKKGIAVFVVWKDLGGRMDDLRRLAVVEAFLEGQFSIVDADGARTRPTAALQQRLLYMQDPGPNWRDWVVVFHVPSESRDLSLVVTNPEPRDGQSRATATKLQL